MKKKLLFVIDSLTIGGAEKSLISLLNMIYPDKYEVDLLLFKRNGELEYYLPNHINILPIPDYFQFLNKEQTRTNRKICYFYYRYNTSLQLRLNQLKKKPWHSEQVVYKCIKKGLDPLQKQYDIAIAYSQGMPTYFVANKVKAKKRFAWINTDYPNTLYHKEVDFISYKKMNKIVTVSQYVRKSVASLKCEYADKVSLILDILNPDLIYRMSAEYEVSEFSKSTMNILTVGRLETAKAYDKAVLVANYLKEAGYNFKWYIIGEGSQRILIEKLIEKYQLNEDVILLGKKINPYPYMKNCDLYVQTSVKEGFGLTVSEAKILKRPIVCTDFPTAKEIINHNIDGWIAEHNVLSIFNGVKKYLDDQEFKKNIEKNLQSTKVSGSVNQLENFYKLVNE